MCIAPRSGNRSSGSVVSKRRQTDQTLKPTEVWEHQEPGFTTTIPVGTLPEERTIAGYALKTILAGLDAQGEPEELSSETILDTLRQQQENAE